MVLSVHWIIAVGTRIVPRRRRPLGSNPSFAAADLLMPAPVDDVSPHLATNFEGGDKAGRLEFFQPLPNRVGFDSVTHGEDEPSEQSR
jgi:hypothetical protein